MNSYKNSNHYDPEISRQTLEKLADILGIGLYKLDLNTGDISLNLNTTRLTGHDIGDLPATEHTKESLVISEDHELVKKTMESVISGSNDFYRIEYRMHRRDSSIASFEEAGIISDYSQDGKPLYLSAMALDLSRLKWAEEKARELELELKRLASGRDDQMLAEENRLLRAANAAAAVVIGGFHQDYDTVLIQALQRIGESVQAAYVGIWRNAEIDGSLKLSQKYHWTNKAHNVTGIEDGPLFEYDDLLPGWKELLGEKQYIICGRTGICTKFLDAFEIKDAGSILLEPFYLHGSFWGLIGIIRNNEVPFTPCEAETLLTGASIIAFSINRHEILGKINRDREKAISNTLAKGEFLSRMSHEMRTPLNAIIGMTNIALKENDPQKLRDHLKKVEVSSHLMLNIINDVLDISKIEAGKFDTVKEPFNFTAMLRNAENIVRIKMDEKQQSFTLHYDESINRMVISDEHRLLQVIVNLLNNAMKFTPRLGKISLKAVQTKISEKHAMLRVEICDNGIGISPEQQKKLFNAFEQADSSIARKYGGTGLGLTICKKIINALGGEIRVKSEPNSETCFYFELETDLGEPVNTADPETSAEIPAGAIKPPRSWGKYTIILADDVEINREIIEISLGETGVNIVSAENGLEVIEKFSARKDLFDLILMDVQMPVMDGLAATKKIRAMEDIHAKEIPIIAMTANAFKEDREICREAGMNEHIAKPIEMDVFFGILDKYFQ